MFKEATNVSYQLVLHMKILFVAKSLPDWLRLPPAVYVQQIILSVEPWNTSQFSTEMVRI